ncbi:MAG TPA: hypothetical protein VEK34_05085 [Methylocella sp.]|nr:hypothetical protein [Methylocella sp.]
MLNFLLVVFNGLLVIATFLLWRAGEKQRKDMLRSIAAAELSANAAKRSTELIPDIQRPYVAITSIVAEFIENAAIGRKIPQLSITFHNFGRTPANIESLVILAEIRDDIPKDSGSEKPQGLAMEVAASEVEILISSDRDYVHQSIGCDGTIGSDNQLQIQQGKINLYCWGHICYRDLIRNSHKTRFCRRYNANTNGFELVGGMERNGIA